MTLDTDDELVEFEAHGATLPEGGHYAFAEHDGARIWHATFGHGPPVLLLHGGLGHSGNFARQVPTLVEAGYRVILIDSRGHGRSTRDDKPYRYERMAADALAVLDRLGIDQTAIVGWSDGACTGLILGAMAPQRVRGVFFFGCNMDPSGTLPMDDLPPVVGRCFHRHQLDYAALSATPDDFDGFVAAVSQMMGSEPNYSAADLRRIAVPVTIVQSEKDEFIRRDHAEYLAETISGARFELLPGVSHFAPLQRPELFNAAVLDFLERLP